MLPEGAPPFATTLTDDLLDYGFGVMSLALRLRSLSKEAQELERGFLVAGEAIEAAVHRGANAPSRGFHRVSAAVSFHLARYAARAFSVLPDGLENLSPAEAALVELMIRRLDSLDTRVSDWLDLEAHSDDAVAETLRSDPDFDDDEALHVVLTSSFMRAMALFNHALSTGDAQSASRCVQRLHDTATAAQELNAAGHWWTATMAAHLVDDLWHHSYHIQLPELPSDDPDAGLWSLLRRSFIDRMRMAVRSSIELWPSQLEAARRCVATSDDLVVSLPTSAGKTRIAELCILRALASGRRAVYVTPLRALSAQIERDLAHSLRPLGLRVSSLYGSTGFQAADESTLRSGHVVVSTPEKLDFALRHDASLIDDVGIVVLDEGHMIGPSEREVRYEALVQRLLKRQDAAERRVVCLSAMFPRPEELEDLVAWLRSGAEGGPVHSTWRPTRQRFGTIQWTQSGARLEAKVEGEQPYVPRFVVATAPPATSRRRKAFPADKNELTLAAAWRFAEQGRAVLVYCALRNSVEKLGRVALDCIGRGLIQSLAAKTSELSLNAVMAGTEWLGADHPAVRCLHHGVALHHGGLPRPFLQEVERVIRAGECRLVIASPTLAQGLNLTASVLLVPSIWRNGGVIPPSEFANVAGRAGRAFVDLEGLVLHVVMTEDARERRRAIQNWASLVERSRAPQILSGVLQLSALVLARIAVAQRLDFSEVVEYVTGNDRAWSVPTSDAPSFAQLKAWIDTQPSNSDSFTSLLDTDRWLLLESDDATAQNEADAARWQADLASLDAALLALLDATSSSEDLDDAIASATAGSLYARQLERKDQATQEAVGALLRHRARHVWSATNAAQRVGYQAAGVGLDTGQFIDRHLDELLNHLLQAESGIRTANKRLATEAIVAFADIMLRTPPFRTQKPLPSRWRDALSEWMSDRLAADVVQICDGATAFIQDVLAYRLPWAMEAVRSHGFAVGRMEALALTGVAAQAVEAGSTSLSVITLVLAGLSSRQCALSAVESTTATFVDREGLYDWLRSDEVLERTLDDNWPTLSTRHIWLRFYEGERLYRGGEWQRESQVLAVDWRNAPVSEGADVVVAPFSDGLLRVMLPDRTVVGDVRGELVRDWRGIVRAQVGPNSRSVNVEFFGPS